MSYPSLIMPIKDIGTLDSIYYDEIHIEILDWQCALCLTLYFGGCTSHPRGMSRLDVIDSEYSLYQTTMGMGGISIGVSLGKANIMVNVFSRFSIGSASYVEDEKKGLANFSFGNFQWASAMLAHCGGGQIGIPKGYRDSSASQCFSRSQLSISNGLADVHAQQIKKHKIKERGRENKIARTESFIFIQPKSTDGNHSQFNQRSPVPTPSSASAPVPKFRNDNRDRAPGSKSRASVSTRPSDSGVSGSCSERYGFMTIGPSHQSSVPFSRPTQQGAASSTTSGQRPNKLYTLQSCQDQENSPDVVADGSDGFVVYCDASRVGLDCVLIHRGKANIVVDALSRLSMGSVGHVEDGDTKMHRDLQEIYWWSGIKKDITEFVVKCSTCQQVKIEHQKPSRSIQEFSIPTWKWDYHSSICMAPFEALYGRRCISLIGWFKVGEATVVGPNLVLDALEKVQLIRKRLRATQSRQKSYADVRKKDLKFEVVSVAHHIHGSHAFTNQFSHVTHPSDMHVQCVEKLAFQRLTTIDPHHDICPDTNCPFPMAWRDSGASRQSQKLGWILRRIGNMDYELDLPADLASMYLIFHVSLLKKYTGDPAVVMPLESFDKETILRYRSKVLYHEFNKEEQLAALGAEKAILEERKKLKAGVIESTLDAGKNLSVDIDSLLIVQFFRIEVDGGVGPKNAYKGLNRWIEVDHGVGPKNAYKEIDLFQMKLGKKKNQGITSNSKFLFGGHTLANWEHNASHFIIT
ncbi:hypothetical protein FXO38_26336 [Capsicum annuum]|nr:hypothetical protein FXO38_26336 [Capsicum annuum]